jgi:hypothetical protein
MKIAVTKTTIVFISLVFISLMLTGQSYALNLKSAVAIWLFDEGQGDVAVDSTGNGNDATLMDGATWVNGKYGTALSLDGVQSRAQVPATDVFALQDFTIAFFVKPGPQDENIVTLIDYEHTPSNWVVQTEQGMASKMWYMGYYGNVAKGWQVDGAGNVEFTEGVWQHIAFVKSGTDMFSYKDGVLVNTRVNADAEVGYVTKPLNIGAWQGTSRFFNGALDEAMIYNGVLSADDVMGIATKGLSNTSAVLLSGKLPIAWGELKSQ